MNILKLGIKERNYLKKIHPLESEKYTEFGEYSLNDMDIYPELILKFWLSINKPSFQNSHHGVVVAKAIASFIDNLTRPTFEFCWRTQTF